MMRARLPITARLLAIPVCWLIASGDLVGQIDPLLALKRAPPNIVIVLDTSVTMLADDAGRYFDPKTYRRDDDPAVAAALGVGSASYRRIYAGFGVEPTITADQKYEATDILAVQGGTADFETFWAPTRFEIARAGLARVVSDNPSLVRWGLLKLRQNQPAWRDPAAPDGCDRPVRVTGNAALSGAWDAAPCAVGSATTTNRFAVYVPSTQGANSAVSAVGSDAVVVGLTSADSTSRTLAALRAPLGSGALIPAGRDTATSADRPLTLALEDARAHVVSATATDALRDCRNTVVVLVTGGGDDGDDVYRGLANAVATASTFASVAAGGPPRRVPLVVVGVASGEGDRAELEAIAAAGGGRFLTASSVADVARAVSFAVQLGFARSIDVDARRDSDFAEGVVVGTVDLADADDAAGARLPDTRVVATRGADVGREVPQRANVLISAGYRLPGFEADIRAFRVHRPEADADEPAGWRFVRDGTPLWPDLDGRPALAGRARTPSSPATRNIYTYIPDGIGGGRIVAFAESERATLAPHLGPGCDDAEALIRFVRAQPIGAVIGSTPAILDAPSLDPPPDADYGRSDLPGSFVATHRRRRAIVFVGANDGMLHAIDARTGFEVWAFIPYNLLPKLHALSSGQSPERYNYFVDGSPKIAEVKIGGNWRTLLVVGQGYGGTFYSAFDVTDAGRGVDATAPGWNGVAGLLAQFDAPGESITFLWAFPEFSSFDPAIEFSAEVGGEMPGGRVALSGDLRPTASEVEKRVGFTFSSPAIGPLAADRSVNAVIVGSGHFPPIEGLLPARAGVPAGRAIFVLDAGTGRPLSAGAGAFCAGVGCFEVGEAANGRRNALHADVVATGREGSAVLETAYVGDTDGRFWRFLLGADGSIAGESVVDAGQPIYSTGAVVSDGPSRGTVFFGTGSDLLPAAAPGGGGSGAGTSFALFGVRDRNESGPATVVFRRGLSPGVMANGPAANGERPAGPPAIAGDVVFFTTVTGDPSVGCFDETTRAYAFTFRGGAAYDTSGDGRVGAGDSAVVATLAGRGSAPFVADRHLFLTVTSRQGANVALFGEPREFNTGIGGGVVRLLSWREIR